MSYKLTRNELLKELTNQAWNDVLCYSKNYLMDESKEGYAGEWAKAVAKAELLIQMTTELPQKGRNRLICGSINVIDGADKTVEIEITGIGSEPEEKEIRIFKTTPVTWGLISGDDSDTRRHEMQDNAFFSKMIFEIDNTNHIVFFEWPKDSEESSE